jgi:hypothetical protein
MPKNQSPKQFFQTVRYHGETAKLTLHIREGKSGKPWQTYCTFEKGDGTKQRGMMEQHKTRAAAEARFEEMQKDVASDAGWKKKELKSRAQKSAFDAIPVAE